MANKSNENITRLGKALTIVEKPDVITRMIVILGAFCAMLIIGDLFGLRYGKLDVEETFGFYSFFGFAAFAFIIFATKVLKKLLSRPEDYYAPNVIDPEDYPADELDVKEHGDA